MQTQCPKCKALFRVTPAQLRAAEGFVRCSQCGHVFNGREYVSFLKPDQLVAKTHALPDHLATLAEIEDDIEPQVEVLDLELDRAPPSSFEEQAPQDDAMIIDHVELREPTQDALDLKDRKHEPNASAEAAVELPRALQPEHSAALERRGLSIVFAVASIFLVLLLAFQYVYFHRHEFMGDARLAPLLSEACEWIGCELGGFRDISRIKVVSSNVFSHPNQPDALMITVTLANNAELPQAFPRLQISLTDLQGTITAARRFIPSQYLTPRHLGRLMQPKEPVNVTLEIADPGSTALAFELEFF